MLLTFILKCGQNAIAQEKIPNAYTIEEAGYFSNPVKTPHGIVLTDNYASKLYLKNENHITEIVSTPGCGRYYSTSPDGNYIGYKHISKTGMQAPAICDLVNQKTVLLHSPVKLCGQVSFSDNKIAFTIGNKLIVKKGNDTQEEFELEKYTNIVELSPDGAYVAYDKDQMQLAILNINNRKKEILWKNGCMFPKWSPDSKSIAFTTPAGEIIIWQSNASSPLSIGKGENPQWIKNTAELIYTKHQIKNFELINSDVYLYNLKSETEINITNSPDIFETQPYVCDDNNLLFCDLKNQSVCKADFVKKRGAVKPDVFIIKAGHRPAIKPLSEKIFKAHKTRAIKRLPKEIPYIHQVYDTPTWHNGYGSCAPTSVAMAFAYFNRLPKWPVMVEHSPVPAHINEYSSYIADKYRYKDYFFDTYHSGRNSYGGYAHMWVAIGSPYNGGMESYLSKHDIEHGEVVEGNNCTFEKTKAEIDNGYPHFICNYLTSSGHVTLAIGYSDVYNYVVFNDPYGDKNTYGYPSYDGKDAIYDWPGYNNGYQNLGGARNVVPWTYFAHTSEPVYNDSIIDDTYYNHGFHINNTEDGAKMEYYHSSEAGYNNLVWWTYTDNTEKDVCWVTWTPTLKWNATYKVKVYIPDMATANHAKYIINHAKGKDTILIDQDVYNDEWVELGTYQFNEGASGFVYLGDATPEPSQKITFDAVKWEKIDSIPFVEIQHITCKGLNNGAAKIHTIGASETYTYTWLTEPPLSATEISGLQPGKYSFEIKYPNGETASETITITEAANAFGLEIETIAPTATGKTDGEIYVKPFGGKNPYTYNWHDKENYQSYIQDLSSGEYNLSVTDSFNCIIDTVVELNSPVVDMPANLSLKNLEYDKVDLVWDEVTAAETFIILFKPMTAANWTTYTSTTNSYFIDGLRQFRDYVWQVAAISGADTSVFARMGFKTPHQTFSDECTGKFYDSGGSSSDYSNSENYIFTISPPGATQITMDFVYFKTEKGYDYLTVYDGADTKSSIIGKYHGSTSQSGSKIPDVITSSGGSLTFKFRSDHATTQTGWYAKWTSVGGECGTGIDKPDDELYHIFSSNSIIYIKSNKIALKNTKIELFNIEGKLLNSVDLNKMSKIAISGILLPGVYIVKVTKDGSCYASKVIVD